MASVEQQIEQSRARKKSMIKKSVIALVVAGVLFSAGLLVLDNLPVGSVSQAAVAQSEPEPTVATPTPAIDRSELQKALSAAKAQVSPLISKTANTERFSNRAESLSASLENAYTAYGQGDYEQSQKDLTAVKQQAESLSNDYQSAYQTLHKQALTAFEQDNIAAAMPLNQQTLAINPNFADAVKLRQRIDVYYDVMEFYETARIAKVEKNRVKQRDAYAEILQLDPARQDAQAEYDRLTGLLNTEQFNALLSRAVQQFDANELMAAQQTLSKAAAMRPNSNEVATLKARVTAAGKSQELSKLETQVDSLMRVDEWAAVKMLAQSGLQSHPNSDALQAALTSAQQLTDGQSVIAGYIKSPARLADNNIRAQATKQLTQLDKLRELSPSFGARLDQLSQLIEQQNQPVDVTVISDDDTFIKVLGVGVIGEVEEKTIQLKPGNYRFEGSREGYRSKIVDFEVSPADTPIVVKIECTERV
ncbi:MAG: hypothetical protein ACQEQ8_11065 [Pseudomonadota bacterium]